MQAWQPFRGATVVGDVRVLRDLASPQLGNARDLYVYLPPSYPRGGRRYPVVYMQDGQNLFDEETSFSGERAPFVDARIYIAAGAAERAAYVADVERMIALLEAKGYGPDRLRHVVEPGGAHHESAWARRLPDALRFLLGQQTRPLRAR